MQLFVCKSRSPVRFANAGLKRLVEQGLPM